MSFPSVVRLFNERAKTDNNRTSTSSSNLFTSTSSAFSLSRRGSIPSSTTPPSTSSSGPNSGGEERERDTNKIGGVKITDEDRALLESIFSLFSFFIFL